MSVSSVRWRAASAFITAGAAVAVLALAVPAGASTGTTEISPEQAGYTATGAQFKAIHAAVYLRQPSFYAGQVASFGHSVQLWSSGLVVSLGVTASTSSSRGGYTTYATIYDRSTHQVIASNPNAQWCYEDHCSPGPANLDPSFHGLAWGITYDPASGQLTMGGDTVEGVDFSASYTVTGQSFTQARVGTDFGSTPWDATYPHTPPAQPVKAATYSNVGLTTYSAHTSTLWSWWVHHKLLANTEQQSGSDWVAIPTNLTSNGASFQTFFVPVSGQGPNQPVLH